MKRLALASSFAIAAALNASAQNTYPFPASGNVGIGTTSPATALQVGTNFQADDGTGVWVSNQVNGGSKASPGDLYINYGSQNYDTYVQGTKFVVKSSGNVGIGITSPQEKLHIGGNSSRLLFDSNTNITRILFYGDGSGTNDYGFGIDSTDLVSIFGAGGGMTFKASSIIGPPFMRITGGGNVGIGTTNPGAKLEIYDGTFRLNGSSTLSGFGGVEFANVAGFGLQTASLNYDFRGSDGINSRLSINASGNVGIGTTSPTHKLAVNGTIKAKEVIVETTGWSDYVFANDYALQPLAEVEAHIKANKHLPGIPSAAEVATEGISLGDMQARLLAKIEELTLHQIAQEKLLMQQAKLLSAQTATLTAQSEELNSLRSEVHTLRGSTKE